VKTASIATFVDSPDVSGGGQLYRALRDDVAFPYVRIGSGSDYEVVHEDGDADAAGGTVLINPFEVGPEHDATFQEGWGRMRDLLADQQGYLGTRLHRALRPADYRWVNVARWSSPLMFQRAFQQPEAGELGSALPFRAYPALYEVVEG
jgi:heme-degrading monooxygenase HmoA